MGRFRFAMRKIESTHHRHLTYIKRRNGILKQAVELSALCGSEVAMIMFSPSGLPVCFSGNGSLEDIMIRFVNMPEDIRGPIANEQQVLNQLKQLKQEMEKEKAAQVSDDVDTVESLQMEVDRLNEELREIDEQIGKYEVDTDKITTVEEAVACENFIVGVLSRLRKAREELIRRKAIEIYKEHQGEVSALTIKSEDSTNQNFENSGVVDSSNNTSEVTVDFDPPALSSNDSINKESDEDEIEDMESFALGSPLKCLGEDCMLDWPEDDTISQVQEEVTADSEAPPGDDEEGSAESRVEEVGESVAV